MIEQQTVEIAEETLALLLGARLRLTEVPSAPLIVLSSFAEPYFNFRPEMTGCPTPAGTAQIESYRRSYHLTFSAEIEKLPSGHGRLLLASAPVFKKTAFDGQFSREPLEAEVKFKSVTVPAQVLALSPEAFIAEIPKPLPAGAEASLSIVEKNRTFVYPFTNQSTSSTSKNHRIHGLIARTGRIENMFWFHLSQCA